MALGLLVLRVVVGLFFIGHGSQKLFGAFGGHGIEGTGGFFEQLGLKPGRLHALGAGLAEFLGGLLLALGLLAPIAAAMLIGTMTVAIATVHLSKGPWASEGGYEYNLVLIAVAFAVASIGPGRWSVDHAAGIHMSGPGWALAALGAGVLGGLATMAFGRMQASHAGPGRPTTA
jgi:putative oxidoreductase